VNRYVSPLERSSEPRVLVERIDDIRSAVESLRAAEAARPSHGSGADRAVAAGLASAGTVLQQLTRSLRRVSWAAEA
jgi:hypothetical protein